jgi:hypothetical protein
MTKRRLANRGYLFGACPADLTILVQVRRFIVQFVCSPLLEAFRSSDDCPSSQKMKTKVICGGRPTNREKKTRTRIDPWQGNRGVVVGPARRRRSLILAALQLLARKIRAKE